MQHLAQIGELHIIQLVEVEHEREMSVQVPFSALEVRLVDGHKERLSAHLIEESAVPPYVQLQDQH